MEKKYSELKTTILILLRLSKDETTKEIIALRRTGTSATEGKKATEQRSYIYAGNTEN